MVNEALVNGHIMLTTKYSDLCNRVSDKIKRDLNSPRKAAVAFEYIIILVLMVAVVVVAWNTLTPVIIVKAQNVAGYVSGIEPAGGWKYKP